MIWDDHDIDTGEKPETVNPIQQTIQVNVELSHRVTNLTNNQNKYMYNNGHVSNGYIIIKYGQK